MSKKITSGREVFINYYKSEFQDIFSIIIDSFAHKNKPVFLFDPKFEEQLRFLWSKSGLSWQKVEWFPKALYWPEQIPFGESVPGYAEKLIYPVNISSLFPVIALDPKPKENILDACAAPGGKTLAMSYCGADMVVANDISANRRRRMRQTFDDYHITNTDVWGRSSETIYQQYPDHFDKILLDAPCSSEKHVFNDMKYLKEWNPNRIKALHRRQLALLGGLILSLKSGGILVYSTCAVNSLENEGTVGEFLTRKGNMAELINFPKPVNGSGFFCKQNYGFNQQKILRILVQNQFDPMFVAVFRRK